MLTQARKAQLMAYCRIDALEDGEDDLLELWYASAVDYLHDAGILEPQEGSGRRAKYDLCINAMVLDAYEHRGTGIVGSSIVDNPAFQRQKNQLKQSAPVSNLDAGNGVLGGD